MCYYNGVKVTRSEYIRLKSFEKAIADFDSLNTPLHIGFEYPNIPVLMPVAGKEEFDIIQMQWGMLPENVANLEEAKKFRNGYHDENGKWQEPILTLNAMGEELLLPDKMYRESALTRRIIILSTGLYENRHVFPVGVRGKVLKTPETYPYRIGVKDKEYFPIAAIYRPWVDKLTGEVVNTCSMVTTVANSRMAKIHNSKKRMPTMLTDDLAWDWMFSDLNEAAITRIATYQIPSDQIRAYTVIKDFKTAADPTLPFKYKALEDLAKTPKPLMLF